MLSLPTPHHVLSYDGDRGLVRFGTHGEWKGPDYVANPYVLVSYRDGVAYDAWLNINGSTVGLPMFPTVL